MFDLIIKPASPLRRHLAALGFWLLYPGLPHKAQAQEYWQALWEDREDTLGTSSDEKMLRIAISRQAQSMRRDDARLELIEALFNDKACAYAVERQLDELTEDRRDELSRDQVQVSSLGEQTPMRKNLALLGVAWAFILLMATIGEVVIWYVMMSSGIRLFTMFGISLASVFTGLLVSVIWHGARTSLLGQKVRLGAKIEAGSLALAQIEGLMTALAAALATDHAEGDAEARLRAALARALAQCSQDGVLTDPHYFLRASEALLSRAGVPREGRELTLPIRVLRLLMRDQCVEIKEAFGDDYRHNRRDLELGTYLADLCYFDLRAGPEGIAELSCHLPHESDLTILRLATVGPTSPPSSGDSALLRDC